VCDGQNSHLALASGLVVLQVAYCENLTDSLSIFSKAVFIFEKDFWLNSISIDFWLNSISMDFWLNSIEKKGVIDFCCNRGSVIPR